MPFCPRCRREYGPGTARCADCGVELVSSLSGDIGQEDDTELVELAVFHLYSEAEMIQELLESNGIRTILRGEVDPIGVASGATPSTLLVERRDLPRARELYEGYFAGGADDVPDAEEGPQQE